MIARLNLDLHREKRKEIVFSIIAKSNPTDELLVGVHRISLSRTYSSTKHLTIFICNSQVKIFYDSKASNDAMVWFSLFDYSMDNANILWTACYYRTHSN